MSYENLKRRADALKEEYSDLIESLEEKHYIECIEVIADDKAYRKFLKPGEKPEAEFSI